MLPRRDFILKPIEIPYVPLKNTTRDFKKSPPFKKSACLYMTINGGFGDSQYL